MVDVSVADLDPSNLPAELVPEIAPRACDTGVCFDFTAALADKVCTADFAPLMERGATATFNYRDRNDVPIGNKSVVWEDCAGNGTQALCDDVLQGIA